MVESAMGLISSKHLLITEAKSRTITFWGSKGRKIHRESHLVLRFFFNRTSLSHWSALTTECKWKFLLWPFCSTQIEAWFVSDLSRNSLQPRILSVEMLRGNPCALFTITHWNASSVSISCWMEHWCGVSNCYFICFTTSWTVFSVILILRRWCYHISLEFSLYSTSVKSWSWIFVQWESTRAKFV